MGLIFLTGLITLGIVRSTLPGNLGRCVQSSKHTERSPSFRLEL